jgi:hypothetical protein
MRNWDSPADRPEIDVRFEEVDGRVVAIWLDGVRMTGVKSIEVDADQPVLRSMHDQSELATFRVTFVGRYKGSRREAIVRRGGVADGNGQAMPSSWGLLFLAACGGHMAPAPNWITQQLTPDESARARLVTSVIIFDEYHSFLNSPWARNEDAGQALTWPFPIALALNGDQGCVIKGFGWTEMRPGLRLPCPTKWRTKRF